jgi:hypothetical protein
VEKKRCEECGKNGRIVYCNYCRRQYCGEDCFGKTSQKCSSCNQRQCQICENERRYFGRCCVFCKNIICCEDGRDFEDYWACDKCVVAKLLAIYQNEQNKN